MRVYKFNAKSFLSTWNEKKINLAEISQSFGMEI